MVDETTGQGGASNTPEIPGNSGGNTGAPNYVAGAPVPMPEKADTGIQNDIAQILKSSKLPEKRSVDLPGEKRPATVTRDIDAMLNAMPSAPPPQPAAVVEQAPPIAEPPAAEPEKRDVIQSVHTLKQDLQQVVHDQKISVVKAAALEQDRERPPVFATEAPRSNRVKNFVFASILLLCLGAASLAGVYFVVQSRSTPLPEQQNDSLVFAEQTVSLPLDGQSPAQLKSLVADARTGSTASLGSITRIAPVLQQTTDQGPVTNLATFSQFMAAIGAKPPDDLVRALAPTFFFGLHTVDKNAPIIVVPVLSYDRAFAGMLAWEATLNAELAPIYERVPDLKLGEDGIPARRTFNDVVMRNFDVRALTDDNGAVVLYYSFPTRNYLVIAESPYSFTELLSRLQAQKKL